MKISRRQVVSTGKELAPYFALTTNLLLLASCQNRQNGQPEAFSTPVFDQGKLKDQRAWAVNFIGPGSDQYIGDALDSFSVQFPADPGKGLESRTMSGTIFEVKTNIGAAGPATLGLYVPETADQRPVPVLINHLTSESLAKGTVTENGMPVERYGIGAMPMDEAYFGQILTGGLTMTEGEDMSKYLKQGENGQIIPLFNIWFKDITPENADQIAQQIAAEPDAVNRQEILRSHISSIVFNDQQNDRSLVIEMGEKNNNNAVLEFLVKNFFGPTISAHAAPADTPLPTSEPTSTPAPTGAELQSMGFDQLKARYPELAELADPKKSSSAVSEFASAMGIMPEQVGNLTPVLKTTPNGRPVLGLSSADGYPVIIAVQQVDGTWTWSKPYIKLITSVPFGTECLTENEEIVKNVFNQRTVEGMPWNEFSPTESVFRMSLQEDYLRRAIDNNQSINFMHVIYGSSDEVPDWLRNGKYNREELITLMQKHVADVMTRMRKIADDRGSNITLTYTVTNESVTEPGIFWTQRVGPDYVRLAFEAARRADPKAVLIYNDYSHELPTQRYAGAVFNLVKKLKDQGLVDGVGMQMHFIKGGDIDPNLPIEQLETGINTQIDKYAAIGLKTYITELDVDISGIRGTPEEKKKKAAELYAMIARIAVTNKNVALVNTWGMSNETSWINDLGGDPALLFAHEKPQQPYYYVVKELFGNLK